MKLKIPKGPKAHEEMYTKVCVLAFRLRNTSLPCATCTLRQYAYVVIIFSRERNNLYISH